jgi:hypothetical protein
MTYLQLFPFSRQGEPAAGGVSGQVEIEGPSPLGPSSQFHFNDTPSGAPSFDTHAQRSIPPSWSHAQLRAVAAGTLQSLPAVGAFMGHPGAGGDSPPVILTGGGVLRPGSPASPGSGTFAFRGGNTEGVAAAI